MIILDTNVISELFRQTPNMIVEEWFSSKNPLSLIVTAITIAEIQKGLKRLPKGKRRIKLEKKMHNVYEQRI